MSALGLSSLVLPQDSQGFHPALADALLPPQNAIGGEYEALCRLLAEGCKRFDLGWEGQQLDQPLSHWSEGICYLQRRPGHVPWTPALLRLQGGI